MARMRYIKPEFWTDSTMVRLSRDARLFYIGTWNFTICEQGHLEDDPVRLKMQIFPADNVDVGSLLDELIDSGRIIRTEVEGRSFLQVKALANHQKTDPRWAPRCVACKNADEPSPKLSETLPSSGESSRTPRTPPKEGRGGDRRGEKTSSNAPRRTRTTDPDFDSFWDVYPRREAKKAAEKAWAKAIKDTSPARIILGAKRYRDDPNREAPYTALPATWLNGGRWEDEPLPTRATGTNDNVARPTFWDRTGPR